MQYTHYRPTPLFDKNDRILKTLIAVYLMHASCFTIAAEVKSFRVMEFKLPPRTQPGECPSRQDCLGSLVLTVDPKAINDQGVIVGSARVDHVTPITEMPNGRPERPFIWESGKTTFLTPDSSKERCIATGINNAKEVVGYCETDEKSHDVGFIGYGFYWRNGMFKRLAYSARREGESRINSRSEILEPFPNGNIVTSDGAIARLMRLSLKDAGFSLVSINNASVVIGNATSQRGSRRRAIIWSTEDYPVELGCEGDGDCQSQCNGINASGIVVGSVELNKVTRTGYWDKDKFVELKMPTGATSAFAQKINDAGNITGQLNATKMSGPFFWTPMSGMRLIQEMLHPESHQWKIETVEDFNNSNWMIGVGRIGSKSVPILLIPEI